MKKPLDYKSIGGIDLHIHSTASDGTLTPPQLIQMALDLGLQAVAITDHDTLEGVQQALEIRIPTHLRFLPGVEISTQPPEGFAINGSMHVLGYDMDVNHAPLQQALTELQQARDNRAPLIVEKLNRIGIPIDMAQVMAHVGDGSIGRPHIASALIEAGIVKDVDEAFDRYLSKGRPGYVDKYRIDYRRAFELIHQAGGVPVLAHPDLLPGGRSPRMDDLIKQLCQEGLMGVEVYYSHHPAEAVAFYLDLAKRFDLLVTGGSDFHGDLTPEVSMGTGRGDLFVPYVVYEALMSKQQSGS